jgi:hypothetical protein
MAAVDDMFDAGGLVVALELGIEPTVSITPSCLSAVTVSRDDLRCGRCGRPLALPTRRRAWYAAVNAVANDGLCKRCDPVVGPRTPPDFDR